MSTLIGPYKREARRLKLEGCDDGNRGGVMCFEGGKEGREGGRREGGKGKRKGGSQPRSCWQLL